jgi:hypothetical protein
MNIMVFVQSALCSSDISMADNAEKLFRKCLQIQNAQRGMAIFPRKIFGK